ncbi:MAG: DoxX family protein [Bacteroidota bacterium]
MKRDKIIYWVATGLLSLMMVGSAGNYLFNYDAVAEVFNNLGYPSHVVYPLAIAKILGVVAILTRKSDMLKEWAYAGFFFDFALAFMAHMSIADNEWAGSVVATILLFVSYFFEKRAFA